MSDKYSVILVDDEEDVIRTIIHKIDWDSLGFEMRGYAMNGFEAMDLADEVQPDVVMTDIQMPYMDGLELTKKLKEKYPAVKIIVFSGFDKFDYAKEAIRLEVEEYILKPIDAGELSSVFERIKVNLDKERDARQNADRLEHYFSASLPILQETFYTALIEGRIKREELDTQMKNYQISDQGPYFTSVIFHASEHDLPEGMTPLLAMMSVRKLAEEKLLSKRNPHFFNYSGNLVTVVSIDDAKQLTSITDEVDTFCRLAKTLCKVTVSAGIGPVVKDIYDLPSSCKGAREALSYRVIYGKGKAINFSEIAPQEHIDHSVPFGQQFMYDILRSIRMNDDEGRLRSNVQKFLTQQIVGNPSIQEYHFFIMEIVSTLYRFAANNQLDIEKIFSDGDDIYSDVETMNRQELENWIVNVSARIKTLVSGMRSDSTRSFVAKAKDFIAEHYGDDNLNIDMVCSKLGISSSYFSTVFKKETGKTFNTFLTDFRMEQAVRLLVEENEKTYVIAQTVGYHDPNYFSYAFKKKYGMSPSKYKSCNTADGKEK
jgi:two-component system response regulator YesN